MRVTGDWMEGRSFEAEVESHWNGWIVPIVDRETAESVLAELVEVTAENGDEGRMTVTWAGSDAVILETAGRMDPPTRTYLFRRSDGTYVLDLGVCFYRADDQDGWDQ